MEQVQFSLSTYLVIKYVVSPDQCTCGVKEFTTFIFILYSTRRPKAKQVEGKVFRYLVSILV